LYQKTLQYAASQGNNVVARIREQAAAKKYGYFIGEWTFGKLYDIIKK
jgi:hypothetical protein